MNICILFTKSKSVKIADWLPIHVYSYCLHVISTQMYDLRMHVSFAWVCNFKTCLNIPAHRAFGRNRVQIWASGNLKSPGIAKRLKRGRWFYNLFSLTKKSLVRQILAPKCNTVLNIIFQNLATKNLKKYSRKSFSKNRVWG